MARLGLVPRLAAAGVVVAAAVGPAPPPARAAEHEPQILPGRTASALAVDLDADGSREVVRVLEEPGPGVSIDAWTEDGSRWTRVGSVPVPDPTAGDPALDHFVTASALLEVRGADGPRPILLSNGTDLNSQLGPRTCCLTLHDIGVGPGGIRLRPIEVPPISADAVSALDLDGDGLDELVASSGSQPGAQDEPTWTTTALRSDGAAFRLAGSHDIVGWSAGSPLVGETDGVLGDDVVMLSAEDRELVRLAWDEGTVGIERVTLEEAGGGVAGVIGGRIALYGRDPSGVLLVQWPRDGVLEEPAARNLPGASWFGGVAGTGADAVVLATQQTQRFVPGGPIHVLDADFERLTTIEPIQHHVDELDAIMQAASDSGGWTLQRSLSPYSGGMRWHDDREAWIVSGHAILPGGPHGVDVVPFPIILATPVGFVGADDEWLAACDGCWQDRRRTSLFPESVYATGQLSVTPVADVGTDPVPVVSHPAATAVAEEPDGTIELIAAAGGFELVVEPMPGTAVVTFDGRELVDHGIATDAIRLPVEPPAGADDEDPADEDRRFERTLILIGPDGSFSIRRWVGSFAPTSPELRARPILSSDLSADVRGQTAAYATVTVDGQLVAVGESGWFTATIDAPPWPRDVVVVATDPFGGRTETTVEVIGLVDYRGLPWALIVGLGVAGAAVLLFLRVPRIPRPALAAGPGAGPESAAAGGATGRMADDAPGDGVVEDLDDDAIIATGRGRR